MNKDTQIRNILNHFKKYGTLTTKQAFMLFGCTRLPARVHDLRRLGYTIISLNREGKTRYGRPCRYVEYMLVPKERSEMHGSVISD